MYCYWSFNTIFKQKGGQIGCHLGNLILMVCANIVGDTKVNEEVLLCSLQESLQEACVPVRMQKNFIQSNLS